MYNQYDFANLNYPNQVVTYNHDSPSFDIFESLEDIEMMDHHTLL